MPEIETLTVSSPYLSFPCALGEGPFYEEETDVLRFVDIVRKEIHTVSLADGPESHKVTTLEDSVGLVTRDITRMRRFVGGMGTPRETDTFLRFFFFK